MSLQYDILPQLQVLLFHQGAGNVRSTLWRHVASGVRVQASERLFLSCSLSLSLSLVHIGASGLPLDLTAQRCCLVRPHPTAHMPVLANAKLSSYRRLCCGGGKSPMETMEIREMSSNKRGYLDMERRSRSIHALLRRDDGRLRLPITTRLHTHLDGGLIICMPPACAR